MKKAIKAALFDVDGLVLERQRLFSEQFAEEYEIPLQDVSEFFIKDLKPCSMGKADLKVAIAPYLAKWRWPNGVDAFLTYWFSTSSTTDDNVLRLVAQFKIKGAACYLASRQEKYRKAYLLEEVGLDTYFDGSFFTCDIGHDKSEQEYWEKVIERLEIAPSQILFFDDSEKNVNMAKSLGVQAYHYTGIEVLERAGKEHFK